MKKVHYSNIVGSLMYAMIGIKLDMAYGFSLVSRFMSKPVKEHWNVVNWFLRYLKGYESKGLIFSANTEK